MEALDAVKRAVPVVHELFPGSLVYLFGSYAWGEPDEMSDIDMAVILEQEAVGGSPESVFDRGCDLIMACDKIDDRIEPTVRVIPDRTGFVKMIVNEGIRVA